MPGRWSIWIDTGGTFTDCVARDPEGRLLRVKVLSSGAVRGRVRAVPSANKLALDLAWSLPGGFLEGWTLAPLAGEANELRIESFDGKVVTLSEPLDASIGTELELRSNEEAPVLAARLVTRTPMSQPLPPTDLRLATTRGTNALLERRGADVALFVTRGFRDLLRIGNQQRPDLFALEIVRPEPLYRTVVEIDERLAADGSVLSPLRTDSLRERVGEIVASGVRVAAVSLLHSYRNPEHEHALANFLRESGFEHVSTSAELAPRIRYVPRAETAVVDAYLSRAIGDYLARIRSALVAGTPPPKMMTSAGGLVGADRFRPKDSLLSGPAGGVVGAAGAGRQAGFERVIAFDMGGTSTDVSRFDGEFDYRFETRVGDAHLLAPALAIETVAAGGGSICTFENGRLKVGPESAGADPGPACYGAGGPLTVTDVNLLLGRLDAGRFEIPIDRAAAEARLECVAERLLAAGEAEMSRESLLAGFLQIANERMAEAVRRISVREGYDPAESALVAFGGAGAQHGCSLAELLGMKTVLVPQDAGLLSAVGLGHAVIERFAERQVLSPLLAVEEELSNWFDELAVEARDAVVLEGVEADSVVTRLRRLHVRLEGQDSALAVEWAGGSVRESFARAYRAVYGYPPGDRSIEVESLRVVASTEAPPWQVEPATAERGSPRLRSERAWFDGGWAEVERFDRASLIPSRPVDGPSLIFERHSATVVESGWAARVVSSGALVLEREESHG